ncbi:hypothetical protein [uncultured Ruminococcus sp.]|uniref:hypothetical protein n=1 Tax=uncultured Ruminococcus sp. TaxID=165186 RepID=UPI0026766AA5|nr:hypothetical protein [uncultured Ruminococcus sp.]
MKGKTEKILCGFSSIFPKYLGKYARKMRARRYETGSEGKFASRWRAKSPDALCAVLPFVSESRTVPTDKKTPDSNRNRAKQNQEQKKGDNKTSDKINGELIKTK